MEDHSQMDIIFVIILAFIFITGVTTIILNFQGQKINKSFCRSLDVEEHLNQINQLISQTKKENVKDMLLIAKAGTLSLKGDLDEARILLCSINENNLSFRFQLMFYNNKIYNDLFLGNIERAQDTYIEVKDLLLRGVGIPHISESIKATVALLGYFIGEIEDSKRIVTELLGRESNKLTYLECNYILGLIEIKEDNVSEGNERLRNILEMSKGTVYYSRIKEALGEFM